MESVSAYEFTEFGNSGVESAFLQCQTESSGLEEC